MVERVSLQEWIAFDERHPAPTFFARPAWAMALADAYPWMQPSPLSIELSPGRRILLPLMQMAGGRMRWRELQGFPLGAYTCFLESDGSLADAAACENTLTTLASCADVATVVPWPLGATPSNGRGAAHETAVVDLSGGLEVALKNVAGIFRRMAGQAERRGVLCAPSRDPNAVDEYYRLLELSAKRWGIGAPSIPKALIAALRERGGNDVEIWFASAEGRNIGGGVIFYGAQELFFWSAAMDADYGKLRPSNALNFALLRAAAERGVRYYNLGSSEGLPGVAKFKEYLGAQDIAYFDYGIARTSYRMYRKMRRALSAGQRMGATA